MTNGHRKKPSGLGQTGICTSLYSDKNKNPLVCDPSGIGTSTSPLVYDPSGIDNSKSNSTSKRGGNR